MAVPDMTGAEQVAALAGGSIVRKAVPLDGIGTLSVVSDPTGAMIGLIEPDPDHALARAA
jgi:predicted enzyme related to lactoylglutathione lyase